LRSGRCRGLRPRGGHAGGGVYGAAGFAPQADILGRDFTVVRLQTLNIERAQMGQPLPAEYSRDLGKRPRWRARWMRPIAEIRTSSREQAYPGTLRQP
jgi:hypothetical protein